jgi:hypothetical protein
MRGKVIMGKMLVVTMYINSIISCILVLANLPIAGFIVFIGVSTFIKVIENVYRERVHMEMMDEWETLLKQSHNCEG